MKNSRPIQLSTPLPSGGRRPTADECRQIKAWGTVLRPRAAKEWLLAPNTNAEAKLLHKTREEETTWRIPIVPAQEGRPNPAPLSHEAVALLRRLI